MWLCNTVFVPSNWYRPEKYADIQRVFYSNGMLIHLIICYRLAICRPHDWLLIRCCYDTCNATYNQRIIQSTPAIFFISVLNYGCCDYGRKSAQAFGSPTHVLASYLVASSSSVKWRWLYDALIIWCVDYPLRWLKRIRIAYKCATETNGRQNQKPVLDRYERWTLNS
jgi:hypothetical protein